MVWCGFAFGKSDIAKIHQAPGAWLDKRCLWAWLEELGGVYLFPVPGGLRACVGGGGSNAIGITRPKTVSPNVYVYL